VWRKEARRIKRRVLYMGHYYAALALFIGQVYSVPPQGCPFALPLLVGSNSIEYVNSRVFTCSIIFL
jgi:hypothetical protein